MKRADRPLEMHLTVYCGNCRRALGAAPVKVAVDGSLHLGGHDYPLIDCVCIDTDDRQQQHVAQPESTPPEPTSS